jgi:hypothetical protein
MELSALKSALLGFTRRTYPEMQVNIEPWSQDPNRLAITFVEPAFANLYPAQRYHQLVHLIPNPFFVEHLANTVWFEMAPGETVEDLRYPDEEFVQSISDDVLTVLNRSGASEALDDLFCPKDTGMPKARCHGDYRNAREVLLARGFSEDELFDVFHVLMARGGFCDCEILYNAAEASRLKSEYWRARAENREPRDPHRENN